MNSSKPFHFIPSPAQFRSLRLPAILCCTWGVLAPLEAQVVLFTDDFAPAQWSDVKLLDTTPGGDTQVAAHQSLEGGASGAYRSIQIAFSGTGDVLSAHLCRGFIYTPAVFGAIRSVDWSGSLRGDAAIENAQFGYSLVVEQSGSYYQWWQHSVAGADWINVGDAGLTAADFYPAGNPSGTERPDFSETAEPLEFGFLLAKQNSGPITLNTGFDNFEVTVTAVPEPSQFVLVGALSLGVMAGVRRYRSMWRIA
jgi:hypothetical protein